MQKLKSKDFLPATCQATLFTPDEQLSTNRLVRELLPHWMSRFDAEPIILPLGEQAPREIPKIICRNKSGDLSCEIASSRINIIGKNFPAGETENPDEFFLIASDVFEEYVKILNPRIGRVAAIVNWYAKHENPGLFLARHFCTERCHEAPLNRPENFELHAHKRFSMGNKFSVNSWVRNKTGVISTSTGRQLIVLVEQDINTLAEEMSSENYSVKQFREFFQLVSHEFVLILGLYYPEGD